MKVVAQTLGVSRSNLIARLGGQTPPRRGYKKAQDGQMLPLITKLVAARPTYGYRRITAILNRQLRADGLAPVRSPQSNGISEAFVKTLKRDYVQITPLPDPETVLGLIGSWFDDYNENHPHSGLKMRSPREFIAAQTANA